MRFLFGSVKPKKNNVFLLWFLTNFENLCGKCQRKTQCEWQYVRFMKRFLFLNFCPQIKFWGYACLDTKSCTQLLSKHIVLQLPSSALKSLINDLWFWNQQIRNSNIKLLLLFLQKGVETLVCGCCSTIFRICTNIFFLLCLTADI